MSFFKIYNCGHNILELLELHQSFVYPQVKRIVIIRSKNSIYELPHELSKNTTLRILRN